jgi:ABC-type molybdate transport system substrate-binding protein
MTKLLVTLALLAALAATPPTLRAQAAGGLTIAAASDLQTVLPVLTAAFERRTRNKSSINVG